MDNELLIDFFKTFNDVNRLRLAALLLDKPSTVEEIAAHLNMRPVDVPRQLTMLEKLELLRVDGERYRIDARAIEALSRTVLAGHRPQAEARSDDPDSDEFARKVIKNYSLPDGRLREIPLQGKKFQAVLKHVVQAFEPGKRYTEKEVNQALTRYYADFATLRRGLIDHQLLNRENNGTEYWRD